MANAWGSIALGRVAARLESDPVRGTTRAVLGAEHRALRWPDGARAGDPGAARMELPSGGGTLRLSHEGTGRPWVRVETHAAVPVRGPVASGFRIERTVTPVDPRVVGRWSVGDQVRVRLLIDAQVPTPWVVVSDPLPAGAAVLAGGTLAAAQPPTAPGRVALALAPDHEERAADAYRAYFRQVPQGRFVVEYVMRLSQAGRFGRPPSRVEAMYAPEMYGEWPGGELEVAP